MNDDRLSLLVDRYLDIQLSADERSELEDMLRRSAASREQFWRESRIHALLHEVENDTARQMSERRQQSRTVGFRIAALIIGAAALVAVTVGYLYWPVQKSSHEIATTVKEETTTAVAMLSHTLNAQWNSPDETLKDGAVLNPGWLHLKSGLAHIELFNGVGIVLDGPTDVQLISVGEAFCQSGRLRTDVPALARGFTIRTPQLRVVDLGTAFGLYVNGAREEVHVFKGKVALDPAKGKTVPREFTEGEAVLLTADGTLQTIPQDPAAFTSSMDLEQKTDALQGHQLQVWRDTSARLNADPSLIFRLDFENSSISDRTMKNLAGRSGNAGDAMIVGCAKTEGRWAGKGALEFRNLGDRVRVNVPGDLRSMTLVTWVRVDGLERQYNSLFMTDAFEVGAAHWQIRSNGSLHLGVACPKNESPEDYQFDSLNAFAGRLGRWTQLALVCDNPNRQITQYIDGKPIGRFKMKREILFRINHGELGNWTPGANSTDPVPIRFLHGRMDEFEFFNRALTDREIGELYDSSLAGSALQK